MNPIARLLAVTAAAIAFEPSAQAGEITHETHGGRDVRLYTPESIGGRTKAPLLVMLHGCTQTSEGFADATRMDAVAEEEGFVVAYPEQTAGDGLNHCFEWWELGNQSRDAGEPKELADAASAIATAHGLDSDRVYVAGISAGAAMSVILGATYPDRFAAIGVVAGLEYNAASSFAGVYGASTGGGPDPLVQGALARDAMGAFARAVPVMVIHGDADTVVAPINGAQVAAQWAATNTLILGDAKAAAAMVEHIVVAGVGHAWPGGREGGSFSDPNGPDASRTLWTFFEKRTLGAPATPPGGTSAPPSATAAPGAPTMPENAAQEKPDGGCALSGRSPSPSWLALLATIAGALAARRLTRSRVRSGRSRARSTPSSR